MRWCFTLNNWTEDEYQHFRIQDCVYMIIGKEIGDEGTNHLQGYINLGRDNRKRLELMKKIFSARAHFEVAKGTDVQNRDYCSKDGVYEEFGTLPQPGKRNDLSLAVETLKSDNKIRTLAELYPETYVKYHRGFEALNSVLLDQTRRDWKTKLVVLVGPTGSGKSRYCFEQSKLDYGEDVYYKPRGDWWDGYDSNQCVIIDDFYGWIKYDELLKITDRYPYRVPIKGGFRQFLAKTIYITSNVEPDMWYHFQGFDVRTIKRRIDQYYRDAIPTLAGPEGPATGPPAADPVLRPSGAEVPNQNWCFAPCGATEGQAIGGLTPPSRPWNYYIEEATDHELLESLEPTEDYSLWPKRQRQDNSADAMSAWHRLFNKT